MKRLIAFFLWIVCLPIAIALPHWDPEMTSEEYIAALRNYPRTASNRSLDDIIKIGKRSLEWLKYINANRPDSNKISFSSPDTQVGYPIDSPDYNSATIVESLFAKFSQEAPTWFTDIVMKGGSFPKNPASTDEEYVSWGLRLDRIYQKASRWLLMSPILSTYASYRKNDVRGYYYLQKLTDVKATLDGYLNLAETEQENLVEWMAGLCSNGNLPLSTCRADLRSLINNKAPLYPYYQKYISYGKAKWDEYFLLGRRRPDIIWNNDLVETMTVPFIRPTTIEVEHFLTDNIEEEWQFNFWRLRLGFKGTAPQTPKIIFSPGATPHVETIGGNTITMDENQPLTEYNVRWTIRHEFGHVLGFRDCYVEFYDSDQGAMVSYQLDINNLMCSRRRHIKPIHYRELKDNYGRIR